VEKGKKSEVWPRVKRGKKGEIGDRMRNVYGKHAVGRSPWAREVSKIQEGRIPAVGRARGFFAGKKKKGRSTLYDG